MFKATAESTAGAFSAIEIEQHCAGEPPLHVHHREDEAFYILDGEMERSPARRAGMAAALAPYGVEIVGPPPRELAVA